MTKKKRLIFLTNDDGYKSVGINVLTKINKLIFENIWVFAPKFNQSAKSQSITINKNISIKKITNKEYVISGTPVDCVILGLNEFGDINKNSILLMSGINEGVNLGYDMLYSGTVAAAREGALNGIKSIAMSIDKGNKYIDWSGLEHYAPKIINTIIKNKLSNNYFYNINFPNNPKQRIKGVKVVKLGNRKPGSILKKKLNYYLIPSERIMLEDAKPGEDEYELRQGFITITIHDINNLMIKNNVFLDLKKLFRKEFE